MDASRSALFAPPLGAADEGALYFQRFADSSDDVFWLADAVSQRLLYVSRRFEHFWGETVERLLGNPDLWRQAVDAADLPKLPKPFFAPDAEGADVVSEYRIDGRNGRSYWIRDRRFHLRDAQGRIVRVGGIAEDITERKQAELEREALLQRERQAREQAELLAQSKDEFLAVVTHELRSPLSAIRGWAHVLRGSGELNALQIKALDAIDRNTQTQARMVDDLLDSQRILSGKLELVWGRPQLDTLIDEAVEAIQPQAQAKQIGLAVVHDPRIHTVQADINRLRQALVNLLTNAVKFTPEGGSVRVATQLSPDALRLTVQDNGIGLEPGQVSSVFQRFKPADGSNTRPQRGLGLGLSLAQQLIMLHGGQIQAESDGSGLGSTFTVELPASLVTPKEAAAEDPVADWPAADGQEGPQALLAGHRIMIVEDDEDGREALGLILKDHGAELVSFSEAGSAYDYLAYSAPGELPDALVSDIAMPREDGYEFIRRVRALEQQRHRPRMLALALTAFGRAEDRQRAHAAGFDVHVAKPLDSQVVIQSLQQALAPVAREQRQAAATPAPSAQEPEPSTAWSGLSRAALGSDRLTPGML